MENILIIKHGALGDVVLSMGAMLALREQHPQARFTLLTSSPFVAMAEQMKMFSDYIIDNRSSMIRFGETKRIIGEMISRRFSAIYDLQGSQRTDTYRKIMRFFMPAGQMLWYTRKGIVPKGTLYTIKKRTGLGIGRQEEGVWMVQGGQADLSFMHGKGEHFDRLPERYVLLIPGCSPANRHKRWPVASYREIASRLAQRGIPVVVIGTQAEAEEVEAICAGFPSAVNMVGYTELMDIPQIAKRAMAVVGNDTGPTHMASLTGVFSIAVYDYRHTNGILRGVNCVNLISDGLVSLISPETVWEKLEPQLNEA